MKLKLEWAAQLKTQNLELNQFWVLSFVNLIGESAMKMYQLAKQSFARTALMAGALAGLAVIAEPAKAEFSIAYCDGAAYAVNVYRVGDPETPGSALTLRIYSRADGVTFLNTEASREPNPEGYNYSNRRGENEWTLFIPNSESLQCTLSRDGTVVDRGTVTMRESSSGD